MLNTNRAKNEWIREGLMRRGYRQKDLAVAWSSQQASVSRFFGGEELQDLPLSKAAALARMLGISMEELAKGLGLSGPIVEPAIENLQAPPLPLGTVNMSNPRPGVTRIELHKDFSVGAAMELVKVMSNDVLPPE
jgi:hypothetical protein